jgi:5,6,7,8-tetrahydromethanopterin hydro-lyase
MSAGFITQIGEGFAGTGPEAAHVNTVLGTKGGPVETAWVTALATPSLGHAPFVAVLQPGLAVRPHTLFVNKAAIGDERHGHLTWGAAQAGVAGAVAGALADGTIGADLAADLLLIAAVWVDPAAADARLVYVNNHDATRAALEAGARGLPQVDAVLAARESPWNPFFPPTSDEPISS